MEKISTGDPGDVSKRKELCA